MHGGKQCDPIQGQGHDSQALESWKLLHFQKQSPAPFTMAAGN